MATDIFGRVVRLVTNNQLKDEHSEVLSSVKKSLKPGDRLLVIISNADESSFDIGTASCGLTPRDQIALLEVAKMNIYTKLMAQKEQE